VFWKSLALYALCNAASLEGAYALMYRGFVIVPVYSIIPTFMSVSWRFVLGASLRT